MDEMQIRMNPIRKKEIETQTANVCKSLDSVLLDVFEQSAPYAHQEIET